MALITRRSAFALLCKKRLSNRIFKVIRFKRMFTNEASTVNLKVERQDKALKEDILPNLLLSREIHTTDDWNSVREELFKSTKHVTSVNIDSQILGFCLGAHNYNLAYSYIGFLKEMKVTPNLATIGKYFKLFYLSNNEKIWEDDILLLYQELRKRYKLLDAITCENIIHGLSVTKQWKECLKLLDENKICSNPTIATYSVIAAAAFKYGENDIAWTVLDEAADRGLTPYSVAYLAYLEQSASLSMEHFVVNLEKLFLYFKYHDISCNIEVAEKIKYLYQKFNKKCETTVINTKGVCQNCQQKLQTCEMSLDEFEKLKDSVFKSVIIGKNVFCGTSPEELKRFRDFIASKKLYDVVIDGLNVAYSVGTKQSTQVLSWLVMSVVQHFVNKNKKVLVLGRSHMNNWPKKNWNYVRNNADLFLTQTLSQDDPYLLYCALNSGLNTVIVSKDLMRGHLFKLKDQRMKILFRQWLGQNQYQLEYINNKGVVFFRYPPLYINTVQKQDNCWHIPYENVEGTFNKWLCLPD